MIEKYGEYLKLRKTEDPEKEERRLVLKADLAREISEGNGQWYLDRLRGRAYGFASNYGKLAASLQDTAFYNGRREPSLAESVLATDLLEKDYMELCEFLLPSSRAIIKVGSSTWAANFDIRQEETNPTDLDLEVLLDTIEPEAFSSIENLKEALTTFRSYYEDGKADFMSFVWNKKNYPISIHFTPSATFKNNCHKDYFSSPMEYRLREFRVKPKSKPPRYEQRDGYGKTHIFDGEPKLVAGGQITEVPLMMVGAQGQIVMGLIMDKYFAYPYVEGDKDFFQQNVNHFKKNLAQHLNIRGGKFSEFPSRRNRMPYWLLDVLDQEQLCLNS